MMQSQDPQHLYSPGFFSVVGYNCHYEKCTFKALHISFLAVKRFVLRNIHITLSQAEANTFSEMAEITDEITDPEQQLFLAKLALRVIESHDLDKIRALIACVDIQKIELSELQSLKRLRPGVPERMYAEIRFQAYFVAAVMNAENDCRKPKRVDFTF